MSSPRHESIPVRVIGRAHGPIATPRVTGWGGSSTCIVVRSEYADALTGLDEFSHAIIVFWMHQGGAEDPPTMRRPRQREDMPLIGVFAQRGRARPNPIGVTTAQILRVDPAASALEVAGLDAIDNTPILDIKPYAPHFDRPAKSTHPAWLDQLMEGYFDLPNESTDQTR